jgi:hypothetical protein
MSWFEFGLTCALILALLAVICLRCALRDRNGDLKDMREQRDEALAVNRDLIRFVTVIGPSFREEPS